TQLAQRTARLGERPPARKRLREAVFLPARCSEPAHRLGEHAAVAERTVALELGLDLVVADEEVVCPLGAEDACELRTHAPVPVDQRAVAVEGRPPLHGSNATRRSRAAAGTRGSPTRGRRATASSRDSAAGDARPAPRTSARD